MRNFLPTRPPRAILLAPVGVAALALACGGDGATGPGDAEAPAITIVSPAAGAALDADSVDLHVSVADNAALRHLGYALNATAGDTVGVSGTSAAHTFRVRGLLEGSNSIVVMARDAAGNLAAPRTLTVTYTPPDETAPVVAITEPSATMLQAADSVRVSGTMTDARGVHTLLVQLDGATVDSLAVTGTQGTFTRWVRTLHADTNTVTVVVRDAAGNAGEASVQVVRDAIAPQLNLSAPADSVSVVGDSVTGSGQVYDERGTAVTVTVQVNGGASTAATMDQWGAFTFTARGLATGANTVVVRALDAAGNVTTETRHVTAVRPVAACTPPAGFGKAWGGATANWHDAGNWSPAGVPTEADDVFVCAAAPSQPVLAREAVTRTLRLEAGARLETDGFGLTAHGDVLAGGPVTGGGIVRMVAPAATLRGTVSGLYVEGRVTIADTATVTGAVEGHAAIAQAVLPALVVEGRMRVEGSVSLGVGLVMRDAGALLDARGGFYIGGSMYSSSPYDVFRDSVTAGTVRVGGHFGAVTNAWYRPRGTHTLVLDGTTPQTVRVDGWDDGRVINHLQVLNAAGVTFVTDVGILGELTMAGGATIDQDSTYRTIFDTRLPTTTSGYRVVRSVVGSDVRLAGDVTMRLPAEGRLEVGCGSCSPGSRLRVGPHRLTLHGDLYSWHGYTIMTDPAGIFDVRGDVTYAGAYSADSLLAGTMHVGGDLRALPGTWQGSYVYRPGPGHTVVFDGTARQEVNFSSTGIGFQQLPGVEIRNAAGVHFGSTMLVVGQLRMVGAGVLTQDDTTRGIVYASLENGGVTGPDGAAARLPVTSAGYGIVQNHLLGHFAADADYDLQLPAGGFLQLGVDYLGAGYLRLGTRRVILRGDLEARHGQLYMAADAALLDVRGDVTVNDAFGGDSLVAGTLAVHGDFTQQEGPNWGFQPGGTHVTLFAGTAPQVVTIGGYTSMTTRRFRNVRIASGADVTFASNVYADGFLDVFGTLRTTSGRTTGIEHSIYLRTGSTLQNAGSTFCNHTYTRGTNATLGGPAPTCNGGKGTLRVTLHWANGNVDGRLTGPAVDGSTATFTIDPDAPSYAHDGRTFSQFMAPFTDFATGPEVIESYTTAGRYTFEVRGAAGASLAGSGATVTVESVIDLGDRIQVTTLGHFTLPATVTGNVWRVFELENRTVKPLN